jgi:predicted NodU family carbamoyl transferase
LESDADKWFAGEAHDPYMLFFNRVTSDELKAVTHVDGSARTQTVTHERNPAIADLLEAFKRITGYSVLCNTSLNFSGRGFINTTSDLLRYGEEHGLDGFVINDMFVTPKGALRPSRLDDAILEGVGAPS